MSYCKSDIIRRMAEPETVRALRHQKESLEHQREQSIRRGLAEIEADLIRREIKRMGAVPCR